MGEVTHIPRPRHKPAFGNGDLQTSHGAAGGTRWFLLCHRHRTIRAPIVLRIKITAAATRWAVVIHHRNDVCRLEPKKEEVQKRGSETAGDMSLENSRRTKA
jgi:hypothetical protein